MAASNKILLVSWTLPPGKSGSVFVLQQLMNFFSSEEMIVLGEKVHDGVPLPNIHYVASNPIHLAKGNRFIKGYRWLMIPLITREIIRLVEKEKCNAILCFFPDEIYLESARRASKKLGVPFFPYFHNTYFENRKGIAKLLAKKIQAKVFQQAQQVFLMSEGMVNFYQPLYPSISFKALVHPFNCAKAEGYKGLAMPDATIKISFLGNLNESNIDAFSFFVSTIANNEKYLLKIISSTPKWFYEKLGLLKNNVQLLPAVSDENLMSELQQSHVLLLPHGFTGAFTAAEYQTIFPTRTIQYLFSGVPILAFLPANCFLHQFLQKNECAALVVEKSKEQILQTISRLEQDKSYAEKLVLNALHASDVFVAKSVLTELKNDIFSTNL